MHQQCPHCRVVFEVTDDTTLADAERCPSYDRTISRGVKNATRLAPPSEPDEHKGR